MMPIEPEDVCTQKTYSERIQRGGRGLPIWHFTLIHTSTADRSWIETRVRDISSWERASDLVSAISSS